VPDRVAALPSTRVLPWRRIASGLIASILVLSLLVLIGDARELRRNLRAFDWWLLAPVLALTLWNYGWRFVKWQLYLSVLGVKGMARSLSLRIYLAGFAMSLTPGKVGELIKAFYVRGASGSPANRTAAAVVAERLTDGIAMLILAAIGAAGLAYGRLFLAGAAILAAVAVLALQNPERLHRALNLLDRTQATARLRDHALAFLSAAAELLRPGLLVKAVVLGLVSWSGECLAFFLVLIGLGLQADSELLLIATFVLAVSSLLGGASMLPGGLGIADASIAGMLLLLVDDPAMNRSLAVAATLLIRFATLWFAVGIGVIALASLERRPPARAAAQSGGAAS
jgi:uncharacterized protein (TIRG00374 family)